MRTLIATLFIAVCGFHVSATTWQVGPGQTYTLPSQVSELVGDGDTVNIEAGTYPSDVARWAADDLLLRGVGGMAHLESNGMSWGDKAIWVIQGDRTTVEWIEFSECSVPDQNGAGIRQEGRDLTVRHCYFHHNEDGILAGEIHPSTMLIESTEFAYNGFGDGFSHNLYIGNIDSLIFRFNYTHHAFEGHELKSRAWVNVIEYNRIGNEELGEASREIDLPDGGQAYIIGNVVQQGLLSQNSNLIGYALESFSNPGPHELYAVNNTLVNEKANGSFFSIANGTEFFKAYSNILAGGGTFTAGFWPANLDTLANLRMTDIASVGFADPNAYDYHIDVSSPAHNHGYPAGIANSGYPLVAWYEYVHQTGGVLRCQHALLDAGAFETCTTDLNELASADLMLFPNPATESITLDLPSGEIVQRVDLIDALGRVLREETANALDRLTIDLEGLPGGVITVRVWTSRGARQGSFVKVQP